MVSLSTMKPHAPNPFTHFEDDTLRISSSQKSDDVSLLTCNLITDVLPGRLGTYPLPADAVLEFVQKSTTPQRVRDLLKEEALAFECRIDVYQTALTEQDNAVSSIETLDEATFADQTSMATNGVSGKGSTCAVDVEESISDDDDSDIVDTGEDDTDPETASSDEEEDDAEDGSAAVEEDDEDHDMQDCPDGADEPNQASVTSGVTSVAKGGKETH